MPSPPLDRFPLTPELVRLAEAIRKEGGRPILVGGWVRDCLLGLPHSKDFDLEVFGMDPGALQEVLARFGPVHPVGRHFGVLKLATRAGEYDVSVPRRDSKTGKGHKGFTVTPDPAMTFDLAAERRDFTMNAMGFAPLERTFLDPFGGLADLEARVLRHVGPAFGEDPLRVLRAMQFAARFELSIVPETVELCRRQDLTELPKERLWEEVRKLLLKAARPSLGLQYARALGVLSIFPELDALEALGPEAPTAPWRFALAAVDQAARLRSPAAGDTDADLALALAALCHELGRTLPRLAQAAYGAALAEASVGATEAFLGQLTNEVEIHRRVLPLVRLLPRVEHLFNGRDTLARGAVRRLALEAPLAGLARLSAARERALGGSGDAPMAAWLEARARADGVWERPLAALLKGRHLLELGLKPGPGLGRLLDEAYELQLEGKLDNVHEAQAWARERLATHTAGPPSSGALPR